MYCVWGVQSSLGMCVVLVTEPPNGYTPGPYVKWHGILNIYTYIHTHAHTPYAHAPIYFKLSSNYLQYLKYNVNAL